MGTTDHTESAPQRRDRDHDQGANVHGHDDHDHGDHDHGGSPASRKNHDHHHAHGDAHGHGLGHHHGPPGDFGKAFVLAIALNSVFVVVEFGYGFIANSTALMADAGHNVSDVLGLLLAYWATRLARKTPTERFTFGLRGGSILAALANAVFLLLACGGIALEAIQRFSAPPPVAGKTVIIVALVGILINGFSAWLFARGSKSDLNVRGAYLHMLADAVISLGVVLAGIVMMYTGWYWLDAVASLVIVGVIVAGTWGLLRDSMHLALSAVPSNIDAKAIQDYLKQLPGVAGCHDLHIWGLSTTEAAMTVHLVMPQGYPGDGFTDDLTLELKRRFSITHSTVQIEQGTTTHTCALHPAMR